MIRPSHSADFEQIYEIINDAASAYKGLIPADRWHEPYMSREELQQLHEQVQFWCYTDGSRVLGVMGIQVKDEVTLIRHAYVRTHERQKGIGSQLLQHLCALVPTPILIGT